MSRAINSPRKSSAAAALAILNEKPNTGSSISEISDSLSTDEPPLEVTHEEHLQMVSLLKAPPRSRSNSNGNSKGGVRRLTHLLSSRPGNNYGKNTAAGADNGSVGSGNKSLQSAANYTIGSYETVKISNIKQEEKSSKKDGKKRWNQLKRMIGVKTAARRDSGDFFGRGSSGSDYSANGGTRRQRAQTEDSSNQFKPGRRVRSSPGTKTTSDHHHNSNHSNSTTAALSRRQQEMLDDSILGRFDGVDILYLGGAQFAVPASGSEAAAPWDDPFQCTFTGTAPHWSAGQIVTETMWSSGGKDPPEIMLDGVYPGADCRWSVRIEEPRQARGATANESSRKQALTSGQWWSFESPPHLQPSGSYDTSDDCSLALSSHKLRSILWGSNPAPADVLDSEGRSDENPMHSLAARCSIPIDIDDDSFLISTREHIQAIHDIVSLSLAKGQFEVAFQVLQTLLHGLDSATDPDLRFVKGATLHNMGVLQLLQESQQRRAVTTFQLALDERAKFLPPNHPDLAVSLLRKSNACLAAGKLDETVVILKKVLCAIPTAHLIRAKVFNNLGVAYYFQCDGKSALREFTKALEIQRQWLESPVRRETTVYDAAVTLCNMGKVYLEQSEFDLSYYLYEEALLLLTTIFRKDHDMVLTCLASLAMAKAHKGQLDNALQILQGCLRSQNSRFGVLSPASVETVGLSSYLYARQGDFENALKCLCTVRKWQKVNLPEKHPALLKSKEVIKALEAKLGTNRVSKVVAKVWV